MRETKLMNMIMYEIKPTLSKKEFLKKILLELVYDDNAPLEIFDLIFDDVKINYQRVVLEVEKEVLICHKGSIGHNKKRECWIKEEKIASDGRKYHFDVLYTLKTTDWLPSEVKHTYSYSAYCDNLNGHKVYTANENIEEKEFVKNDGKEYAKNILNLIKEKKIEVNKSKANDGTIPYIDETFLVCEKEIQECILKDTKDYLDDEKNLIYQQEVIEENKIICYEVPEYSVNYIYKGNEYRCYMEALPEATIFYDIPREEIRNRLEEKTDNEEFLFNDLIKESEKEEIKKETKKELNKLHKLVNISWIITFAILVLSLVLCFVCFYYGWIAVTTLIVISTSNHIQYDKKYFIIYEKRIRNEISDKRSRKIKKISYALKRNNLEEINADEHNEILEFINRENDEIIDNPRDKSKVILLLIITLILLLFLLVISTLKFIKYF